MICDMLGNVLALLTATDPIMCQSFITCIDLKASVTELLLQTCDILTMVFCIFSRITMVLDMKGEMAQQCFLIR
ncbi:hypothetical protein Pfo_028730 [Paulownia fortunei]|nr:hypothetical protein Pfo_028730 [Paulownia fortunei]